MLRRITGHRLFRDSAVSFAGYVVPILAAILCIPLLVAYLGTERFGVFTLMAAVVGYAGLFDLGLGRTLGRMVAHRIGEGRTDQVNPLFWTSMMAIGSLGILGWLSLVVLGPPFVARLQISAEYLADAESAFVVLAAAVPLSMFVAALRALLQAHGRFRFVGSVSAISGSLNLIAPTLVVRSDPSLVVVAGTLVAVRLATFVAYVLRTFSVVEGLGAQRASLNRTTAREVITFGGWMSVTNIIGPVFFYADRVVLGLKHAATAIAYYTTPYDVMVRLLVLPAAFVDVLFPEFSRDFGAGSKQIHRLYNRARLILVGLIAPVCLGLALLAHPLLEWWLGSEFADEGYRVIQLMALGIVLNSAARISQTLLQALGRPDWAALLQVGELILYVGYMPYLVAQYEVVGAAGAWLLRVTISFAALTYLARVALSRNGEAFSRAELR